MNVALQYGIAGRTRKRASPQSAERAITEGRLAPGGLLPPVRTLGRRARDQRGHRGRRLPHPARARPGGRRGPARARGWCCVRPLLLRRPARRWPRRARATWRRAIPTPPCCPTSGPPCAAPAARPACTASPRPLPALRRLAARQLEQDGIPAASLAVVGGAMDGVERVLQAHLRPGDRIAVEDPGLRGRARPRGRAGPGAAAGRPRRLRRAAGGAGRRRCAAGARAVVLTPRAQNPTGAAFDEERARALRAVLDRASRRAADRGRPRRPRGGHCRP